MKLTDFIRENHPVIIREWEQFAATLRPAAEAMSNAALRDHAEEILTAIVADMEKPQNRGEQAEKSKGQGEEHRLEAVGQIHAGLRVDSGFKLNQLVAEYRALRGSILRLAAQAGAGDLVEATRFNEAIDEALTEATLWYSAAIEETRDQFLAILGHDLRNPLAGIMLSADSLRQSASSAGPAAPDAQAALRILKSAGRMERMVKDLLDLTRTRFGGGIPVAPKSMDMDSLVRQVLGEFDDSHPDHKTVYEPQGDLHGEWDQDRIAQVISNLVGNALQHGDATKPIRVTAQGLEKEVLVDVQNEGKPIPPSLLPTIFDSMVRQGEKEGSTSLGLGLYIAREIVGAHGGTIKVTSTKETGTIFKVRLPRRVAAVQTARGNVPSSIAPGSSMAPGPGSEQGPPVV